jgi:hypothetical protein
MDLVARVVVEGVEVRAAGRLFQRNVVGDDRDCIRLVGAHKGVQVGVVGARVLADQRRLAVAGCVAGTGNSSQRQSQQARGSDA